MDVRITEVETFLVAPRWLFVRVETDDGVVGWGEPALEGFAEVVRTAVHHLAGWLIGKDPLQIERHWQVLTKTGMYRGGPVLSSAVAGLDQALWDIAGKHLGAPVHVLLGGPVRDRVRMYGWVGGDQPGEVGEAVAAKVDEGFTAVKMNASGPMSPSPSVRDLEGVAARLTTAREALGPDRDVAVDFHGRFTTGGAIRALQVMEDYVPMFAEEPVLPEHTHLLRDVASATSIPIATGERLYARHEFLPALQGGIRVAQPDLSHAGGITEVRKIAALAETFDVQLAPHCPLGPIALAACLQVALSTQNHLIQEMSLGIHYNEGLELLDYLVDPEPFKIQDGYIERLTQPGLGVDVDEAAVRAADRRGHRWRPPVWSHEDGAYAEW
jgi:galactonate dehydratase